MKKILQLLLVLFPIMAISQTVTQNYIKTTTYKVPTQTDIVAPTITQANQSVNYFDGLGRPVQQVQFQQSASGKDIVTPIEYDAFGRQLKEYLPYASTQSTANYIDPATLVPDLITQYKTNYGTINANPFSEKQLESSPLNRVLKQAAPGNDWVSGSGHEIKMDYQTNAIDEVKIFKAAVNWDSLSGLYNISFSSNGNYPASQLYKTITYDENTGAAPTETNGSTVEFKNKEGQVILKRTYGTVGTGTANEKHDTYYVYDIYGNLTYVIPPKAVDLIDSPTAIQANVTSTAIVTSGSYSQITASNSITLLPGFNAQSGSTFSAIISTGNQTVLDNLCYQYKYDNKNRLVEKKLPGKQWEFIVYDKLDRVVATGPANSPFSDIATAGWSVTKYDVLNRPVLTAWLPATVTSADRKTLQDTQNGLTANFSETKIAAATNTIVPSVTGVAFRYTSVAWPTSGYHVMTVNYYDDYNYPNPPTIPATVETQAVYYNTTVKPKGLSTGSWIRVLETSTLYKNESAYILYDAKARPIRAYTQNHLGGYTYTDSNLDPFTGKLLYSITRHKRLAADTELMTKDVFTYSAQDRLLTQTHQINTGTVELIASNTYDELGQLVSKKVGNTTASPTQNINYSYNIRGWLTGINDVTALTKAGDPKDLFAFRINYNTTTTTGVNALYNGNISETYWTSANSETILRGYGYAYDNLNRLKTGIFKQNGSINNFYDETLTYDKNGNIMSVFRNGNATSVQQIDNLVYSYGTANSINQLTKVVDNATTYKAGGFVDSAANTVDDYSYDANGNMTKDNNKNITAIAYNHLNLPTKITFASTGNIVYIYNAAGQKVQKIVNETSKAAITTDYLGGYQYDNTLLKFFPTEEGYVEPSGSSYKYVYQYKDHLGNVRLSYDKTLAIKEESNFYPFGLKQEGYNNVKSGVENKYKYNGKELQDELGLNMYDYGARNYDPALGRWMNIDPLAEKSRRFNPYTYALNNPVFFIDPDGMEAKDWVRDGNNWIYRSDIVTADQAKSAGYSDYSDGKTNNTYSSGENTITLKENGKWSSSADNVEKTATDKAETKPLDVGGQVADIGGSVASSLADNSGISKIGSNGALYLENANGNVFNGNQYVSTTSISSIGGSIDKFAKPVGIAINLAQIGVGAYKDGGYGDNAKIATGNAAGSMIGAEMGGVMGAEFGATVGTLIMPGVGTFVGGVIGGIGGAVYGGIQGGNMGKDLATTLIKN